MKLLIFLISLSVIYGAATTLTFTSLEKFAAYNHPDGRSCLVDLIWAYDSGTAAITTSDNGTQSMSDYWEVYWGKDTNNRESSIACTDYVSETIWRGCIVWEGKDMNKPKHMVDNTYSTATY